MSHSPQKLELTSSRLQSQTSDEVKLRALFDRLTEAWNRGDGAAYAALFAENATYVVIDGTVYRGRRAIAEGHQAIFDTFFKGSILRGRLTEIRFVRPDLAIVVRTGSVNLAGAPPPSEDETVQTFIATCDAGDWVFQAFQNTPIETRQATGRHP